MSKQRYDIYLPTIRDDESGYKYLSRLVEYVMSNPEHIYVFDFTRCSAITHNGLAVVGGLCNYLKQYELNYAQSRGFGLGSFFAGRNAAVNVENMNPLIKKKLADLGFWNYVMPDSSISKGDDYIGYREHDTVLEDSQIIAHLQDSWLTNEKLSVSELLKNEVVSSIYEIFVNAYGHGLKSNPNDQSVISCGYYEPKVRLLSLSVLDLGGGIVSSVQNHTDIRDERRAFCWALETGNSTRTDSPPDVPRGLGFGILNKFITANGGTLRVCSDAFMATANDAGGYTVTDLPGRIVGTLVSITVNCDNRHYRLKSEVLDNFPSYF